MLMDQQLKSSCSECGSTTKLFGSNWKHMTLCLTCGKTMMENRAKYYYYGTIITRLLRIDYEASVPPVTATKQEDVNEPKSSVKDVNGCTSKSDTPPKGTPPPPSRAGSSTAAFGLVSEEEIRAVLMQKTPVTLQQHLAAKFKARLRS